MKQRIFKISVIVFFIYNPAIYADGLETFGDVTQIALPITAAGVTLAHKDLPGFTQFAYAGLTTVASVQVLKHVINRTRPNGHEQSFPSGHTAAAFWGAGFLQFRYGWSYGVPAFVLAGLTGYSRIESKNHWTIDVLAGAAIGIGSTLIFTSTFNEKTNVSPYFDEKRKETGVLVSTKL